MSVSIPVRTLRAPRTVAAVLAVGLVAVAALVATQASPANARPATSVTIGATVYFDNNSAALTDASKRTLRGLIARIPDGASLTRVVVTGHVRQDGASSTTYQQRLSLARAHSAAGYLKARTDGGTFVSRGAGVAGRVPAARNAVIRLTYVGAPVAPPTDPCAPPPASTSDPVAGGCETTPPTNDPCPPAPGASTDSAILTRPQPNC